MHAIPGRTGTAVSAMFRGWRIGPEQTAASGLRRAGDFYVSVISDRICGRTPCHAFRLRPPAPLGSAVYPAGPAPSGRLFRRRNECPYRSLEPAVRMMPYSVSAVCAPPSLNRPCRWLRPRAPERRRRADGRTSRPRFTGDSFPDRRITAWNSCSEER